MTQIPISEELILTLFGTLLTVIGGILLFIFGGLVKKVDRLGDRIETMDASNAKDHATVLSRLSAIDTSLSYITRTVDDHEERISEIEDRERKGE
jgi:hypothetical protein